MPFYSWLFIASLAVGVAGVMAKSRSLATALNLWRLAIALWLVGAAFMVGYALAGAPG